jgi:hypothetical protein
VTKLKAYVPIAATSALLVLFAGSAQAVTFNLSGSSGSWTGTVGGSNIVGIGTNEVRWGVPANNSGLQSGLGFNGVGSTNIELNEIFSVGTLTHFNNVVSTAASAADLQLNLDFSTPDVNEPFNFTFAIDETPNGGICPYPSQTPCSDRITFPRALPSESFSFGGEDYTLNLVGFGNDPANFNDGFISEEGGSNAILLFARIVEAPVSPTNPTTTPEPMSLAGLGMLGLYLIGRRRSKKEV